MAAGKAAAGSTGSRTTRSATTTAPDTTTTDEAPEQTTPTQRGRTSAARKGNAPWAGSYVAFLKLSLVVIGVRILFQALLSILGFAGGSRD